MIVNWSNKVNKKFLRDTSWEIPCAIVEDATLSGKKKRRIRASQKQTTFKVSLYLSLEEYNHFKDWYKNVCRQGANSFLLPEIDNINGTDKEYRFTTDDNISVSNPSGDILQLSFSLEEVQ